MALLCSIVRTAECGRDAAGIATKQREKRRGENLPTFHTEQLFSRPLLSSLSLLHLSFLGPSVPRPRSTPHSSWVGIPPPSLLPPSALSFGNQSKKQLRLSSPSRRSSSVARPFGLRTLLCLCTSLLCLVFSFERRTLA